MDEFDRWVGSGEAEIIDVREEGELPEVKQFGSIALPLGKLGESSAKINGNTVILFCRSGQRSLLGVDILKDIFGNSKKIYSLQEGIINREKQYLNKG